MKIHKVVTIKEVAKIRDKLIKAFEREKKHKFTEEELKYNPPEEMNESAMDWVIEEIQNAFDFDGEEEDDTN